MAIDLGEFRNSIKRNNLSVAGLPKAPPQSLPSNENRHSKNHNPNTNFPIFPAVGREGSENRDFVFQSQGKPQLLCPNNTWNMQQKVKERELVSVVSEISCQNAFPLGKKTDRFTVGRMWRGGVRYVIPNAGPKLIHSYGVLPTTSVDRTDDSSLFLSTCRASLRLPKFLTLKGNDVWETFYCKYCWYTHTDTLTYKQKIHPNHSISLVIWRMWIVCCKCYTLFVGLVAWL